jgi:hypothetical protein
MSWFEIYQLDNNEARVLSEARGMNAARLAARTHLEHDGEDGPLFIRPFDHAYPIASATLIEGQGVVFMENGEKWL